MQSLRECLEEAKSAGTAIGHFNVATLEMFHGVVAAAGERGMPVIIGVTEGERDFMGIREIVSLVRSIRETTDQAVFLNADHTYSVERVKEAIDAGFDAVIFDGAKLSIEENIRQTKECVEYARASGREVLVEAELGYIGMSSKLLDAVPDGAAIAEAMTTVEDAKRFVVETGVDLFAPAVGNIHGMLKDAPEPRLSIERIKAIAESVSAPLVLHGASGNSDEDIGAAVAAGIRIVHVSTEIRVAFKKALADALAAHPDELAPYRYLPGVQDAVQNIVEEKMKLLGK
jgi:fructose-bisphosphate aldolase, class II